MPRLPGLFRAQTTGGVYRSSLIHCSTWTSNQTVSAPEGVIIPRSRRWKRRFSRFSTILHREDKCLSTLENRLKHLSLSPLHQQNQRALPSPQQLLELPASITQPKSKSKGQQVKGKRKNKGGKTQSSTTSTTQIFTNFQAFYKLGSSARE